MEADFKDSQINEWSQNNEGLSVQTLAEAGMLSNQPLMICSLEYVYHDCFILRLSTGTVCIFDYWKETTGGVPARYSDQQMPHFLANLDRATPLYIFISHHHKDHYNPGVFRWIKEFSWGKVIVSKDIAKFSRHLLRDSDLEDRVEIMSPGEVWNDSNIEVRAFGSTDIGNSYALEVLTTGQRIFHAGDLNDWIWLDESTEEEVFQMEDNFKKILREIAEWSKTFWISMFPVDSRIGRDYWRGAHLFLTSFRVGHFFPMHFELGETEEERERLKRDARAFGNYMTENCREYVALQRPGDTWATIS